MSTKSPIRVVSGGQTGVDRAALDAALDLGIAAGGWCPRGRRAEDGTLDARYPLVETPSDDYEQRTAWNVRDSDGTLILAAEPLTGGTLFTHREAERTGKSVLVIDPARSGDYRVALDWIVQTPIATLNVAGPRGSSSPYVYERALLFCLRLFTEWRERVGD